MIGVLLLAQLAIVAHAADTVGACEPLEVSVAVSVPGTALPQLIAPAFAPFDVMRSSSTPQVERDSRAVPSTIVEYRYVLVASQAGSYTILPFEARLGSAVVQSRALHVTVAGQTETATPTVITRARIDTGERINLRAAEPETVYVGQQANYSVAVFLNAAVRSRLRRNPTFYPPDMQSMLAYDIPGAGSEERTPGMSSCFDALVYRRALFPLQTGRLVIPPAQLTYSLPVGASFFSREESHELQTDSAVIIAVEPPVAGQPPDFDGAVGDFHIDTRLQSGAARVGDPFTLTVRVSGTGNVKLLPSPRLNISWADAVPSDQRVHVDSTGPRIGGSKDFDWILTPHVAGELDVPPVRYSYFNPQTRRYELARSDPVRVHVQPGALAAVDSARRDSALSVRAFYGGAAQAPLSSHPVFWVVLALAPLPALRARWRNRRSRTSRRRQSAVARMTAAARSAPAGNDGRVVRRAYVNVLADRLGLDAEAFTTPGALRRALRRSGVSDRTADDAETLLRDLDSAAFAPGGTRVPDAGTAAVALVRRIDDEALPRQELPYRGVLLAGLLLVGIAGGVQALQRASAADAFTSGVVAYQERDYAGAREDFARVVQLEPRAADAWVNLGTTAWATRDTVNAIVGWRRALGLQPLAGDARARLGMVHGLRALSPGYVPPIPINVVLALMAACWLAACLAWHPAPRRRAAWMMSLPVPMVVAAAAFALSALALDARLAAHGTAVVQSNTSLRDDPAYGADQGPTVVTGEIVRVLNQSGAWDRVEVDGGRQGWLPVQGLQPLDAPASSLD